VRFQEKWRLALTLVRQIRAARFEITAVLGDAEFGDSTRLRRTGLADALGISCDLTVFCDTPRWWRLAAAGLSSNRHLRAGGLLAHRWRTLRWRNAPHARQWSTRFSAARLTPAHQWRQHLMREVCLLAERDAGATPRTKYCLIHLPRNSSASHDVSARLGAAGPSPVGH
jgi:hypothetical protein